MYKALVIALLVILVAMALLVTIASPAAAQDPTATPEPTATPVYEIVNTVSLGEYGITIAVASQCLLISLMGLAAFLWVYIQPRRAK